MAKNYESELSKVYSELEDGDLSVEQAMQKSNALTAEMAAEKAVAKASETFQTTLQERDAENLQKQFLADHPDFVKLRDSGKLEPIKKGSRGLHDDFSAYFAFKAEHPMGVEEEESPGAGVEQTGKPQAPLSDDEIEASMLKAIKGA